MPTNQEARDMAKNNYGAQLFPFNQQFGDCSGYVAWWIRCRFKGNGDFWKDKYFMKIGDDYRSDVAGYAKAFKMQGLMNKQEGFIPYITTGAHAERDNRPGKLITKGKYAAATGPNIRHVGFVATQSVGSNCENISEEFRRVASYGWISRFRLTTHGAGNAHAVALDGSSQKSVYYFDPNLGEFQFDDVEKFLAWWAECYLDWGNGRTTAFGCFSGEFNVHHFGD